MIDLQWHEVDANDYHRLIRITPDDQTYKVKKQTFSAKNNTLKYSLSSVAALYKDLKNIIYPRINVVDNEDGIDI